MGDALGMDCSHYIYSRLRRKQAGEDLHYQRSAYGGFRLSDVLLGVTLLTQSQAVDSFRYFPVKSL